VTVRTTVASRTSTGRRQLAAWLAWPASALTLLGVVVVASALIATGVVLVGGGGAPRPILWLSLGAATASLCLAGVARFGRLNLLRIDAADSNHELVGAVIGALVVLVPLSLVPLSLFIWRKTDDSTIVLFPPLVDRRYLVAAYYLVVLGVPLALLLGARIAKPTRAGDTRGTGGIPGIEAHHGLAGRRLRPLLLAIAGIATATYFYGPPWGARAMGGPIDYHETVHFTGLQAIQIGDLPYIGSASDQYGPGTQLFIFGWMKLIGDYDLSGFREAYAAQHWLAIAFVCLLVLFILPRRAALMSLALAVLVFPTFQIFGFDDGGYNGFFGWGNVGRYSGLLLLGLALPHLLLTAHRNRLLFGVLGVAWGITCLAAQESLLGGLLVGAAVVTALLLSASVQRRDLRSPLLALGAGWATVVVPVMLVYLGHGEFGQLLRNYFLGPVGVANGWSNTTWWQPGPWHRTYLLLPAFTLLCGLIAVGRLRPLAIVRPWSRERGVLFGCFAAAAVAQAGAFLRSDMPHLFNVMLVTPILVGATAAQAGQLLGLRNVASRSLVAAGVVAVGVAILPWSSSLPLARDRLTAPLSARTVHLDQAGEGNALPGVAGRRLGPGYRGLPQCCNPPDVSVGDFVYLANQLRLVIGDRRTYVSTSVPDYQPGLWYFMADLHPFDLPLEPTSMAFDRDKVAENLRALGDRGRPLDAVVTSDPMSEDSRIAIERLGSHAMASSFPYAGTTVQVFLASRDSGRGVSAPPAQKSAPP
jgi:hypothetical protein